MIHSLLHVCTKSCFLLKLILHQEVSQVRKMEVLLVSIAQRNTGGHLVCFFLLERRKESAERQRKMCPFVGKRGREGEDTRNRDVLLPSETELPTSPISSYFLSASLPVTTWRKCTNSLLGSSNGLADTPPRGWNSYDSFGWVVNEEEFLANADIVSKRLLKYGYEYVVVDYLWYRSLVDGANRDSYGYDVLDSWGRVIPDPQRWPSSKNGLGFTEVARKVHEMGLKFGIHLMRGISTQAFNSSTHILDVMKGGAYEENGQQKSAKDIGLAEMTCAWMKHGFMSVDTDTLAGKAFLRSLYTQYAEWGVDFVKLDCIFGNDLDIKEIMTVSEILEGLNRTILLSISPGTSVDVDMARRINCRVNMYRITGDDWDTWNDVESHFNIARDLAANHMIGANGLHGRSWPDLDMLPLGWLTDSYGNQGPYRKCNLTIDEQRTQMTLWSMARSPLIFGGDLRNTDEATFSLITNPTLLEINSFSTNNQEFPYVNTSQELQSTELPDGSGQGLEKLNKRRNYVVGHRSCMDPIAKGWFLKSEDQAFDQICWNDSRRINDTEPFCVYKRQSHNLFKWDESKSQYHDKIHLLESRNPDNCFDASTRGKLTASQMKSNLFSPCRWESHQMWELSDTETLKSNYSGLCATIEAATEKGYASNGNGGRAWVATGRQGEIYLAFFNLNSETTEISINIPDLAKVVPGTALGHGQCKGREIWSERDFGVVQQLLSVPVASHGCALFVLNCT